MDQLEKDKQSAKATEKVSYWLAEIRSYDKTFEDWVSRCKKITDRYRDERENEETKRTTSKYNVLWANVQLLGPSVYFRQAKPWIERRFKERAPAPKRAAEMLERAVAVQMEANQGEFHNAILGCRDDWLLYARGQAWFRYEPRYEDAEHRVNLTLSETAVAGGAPEYMGEDGKPVELKPDQLQQDDTGSFMMQPYKQVVYEQVRTDYVGWEDFGHCAAKRWEQVYGVWRCLHMLKSEVAARFDKPGHEVSNSLTYDTLPDDMKDSDKGDSNYDEFAKAKIYEIWSKKDRKVLWICPSYKTAPLDEVKDPLGLQAFYPCPKPLFGTMTTNSLIPVPDFSLYQDQARELDDVTARIKVLTALLALKGCTDATHHETVKKLLTACENDIVAVKDWVRLQRDGGIEKVIEFFPLEEIAGVLKGLFEIRENIIDVIYQVTGLSDIMRGDTDPRETLGAQEKKSQYGSIRLRNKQEEIQRFNKDCVAIIAEIVAEHFEKDTFAMIAGDPSDQEDPQVFDQAFALLEDESLRTFRIDIETDSTSAADEQANKEAVNEFLASMGSFMEQIANLMQTLPAAVPLAIEMMLFAARQMKAGRACEGAVEQFAQSIKDQMNQPQQPPPPDPAVVKAQADAQTAQQDAQVKVHTETMKAEIQKLQLALQKQKDEQDALIKQLEIRSKEDIQAAKNGSTEAVAQMKLEFEAMFKNAEERRKQAESDAKIEQMKQPEPQPFA